MRCMSFTGLHSPEHSFLSTATALRRQPGMQRRMSSKNVTLNASIQSPIDVSANTLRRCWIHHPSNRPDTTATCLCHPRSCFQTAQKRKEELLKPQRTCPSNLKGPNYSTEQTLEGQHASHTCTSLSMLIPDLHTQIQTTLVGSSHYR